MNRSAVVMPKTEETAKLSDQIKHSKEFSISQLDSKPNYGLAKFVSTDGKQDMQLFCIHASVVDMNDCDGDCSDEDCPTCEEWDEDLSGGEFDFVVIAVDIKSAINEIYLFFNCQDESEDQVFFDIEFCIPTKSAGIYLDTSLPEDRRGYIFAFDYDGSTTYVQSSSVRSAMLSIEESSIFDINKISAVQILADDEGIRPLPISNRQDTVVMSPPKRNIIS